MHRTLPEDLTHTGRSPGPPLSHVCTQVMLMHVFISLTGSVTVESLNLRWLWQGACSRNTVTDVKGISEQVKKMKKSSEGNNSSYLSKRVMISL